MDLQSIPVASLLALAVSLFALWRTERVQNRLRAAERFQLQQTVVLKIEAARTEWYMLARELDTSTHRLALEVSIHAEDRAILFEMLQGWKSKIDTGKVQAATLADDIFANVGSYDVKKCRDYLRHIETSIEKLKRNQGELKRQFSQGMELAGAHGEIDR